MSALAASPLDGHLSGGMRRNLAGLLQYSSTLGSGKSLFKCYSFWFIYIVVVLCSHLLKRKLNVLPFNLHKATLLGCHTARF